MPLRLLLQRLLLHTADSSPALCGVCAPRHVPLLSPNRTHSTAPRFGNRLPSKRGGVYARKVEVVRGEGHHGHGAACC